jgi:hypothetical protein
VPSVGRDQSVQAELAFTRPQDVATDDERPGVLRAPDVDVARSLDDRFDLRTTGAGDLAVLEGLAPDLVEHGFTRVDLSGTRSCRRCSTRSASSVGRRGERAQEKREDDAAEPARSSRGGDTLQRVTPLITADSEGTTGSSVAGGAGRALRRASLVARR